MAGLVIKNHVARSVAGAMEHVELNFTELYLIASAQPARRLKTLDAGEAEHFALLGHAVNPETIVLVRPFNRYAGPFGQRRNAAGVIDMTVGDKNLGQAQLPPGSITTALRVFSHQKMVQFCSNGVTGTIA